VSRNITTDNILVMNQGLNPLVSFNFMLRVELLYDLPCKSVKAFTREMEYELIQEGGLNDYVHMRRKPISKPFTLEVERYVGIDYIDPIPNGAELLLPVMLFVSRYQNQFIPGVVARTFVFTGCTVIKKVFGELTADHSGLLTETTTIAYREMLCIDIPWSEVGAGIFAQTYTTPTSAKTEQDKADAKAKAASAGAKAEAEKAAREAELQTVNAEIAAAKAKADAEAAKREEEEEARRKKAEELKQAEEEKGAARAAAKEEDERGS